MDDAIVITERQPGAAKHRGAGVLVKPHDHLPIHQNDIAVFNNVLDFHIQLLTAPGQSVAHLLEGFNPLYTLDAVFKNDVIGIIREDVRPIRFALAVISL